MIGKKVKGRWSESTASQQGSRHADAHNKNSCRGCDLTPETEFRIAGMMIVNVPGRFKHQHQQDDGQQRIDSFGCKSPIQWIPSMFER